VVAQEEGEWVEVVEEEWEGQEKVLEDTAFAPAVELDYPMNGVFPATLLLVLTVEHQW